MAEAATADAKPAEAPAKSGGMDKKTLLIIVMGALLFAGLVGGGVFFMTSKHSAPAADEADASDAPAEAPAKEEKAAKGKKGKKAAAKEAKGPAIYIALDPPFVVNFENAGAVRFLQLTAQIMTRDPVTADKIKQNDPAIRNDLLAILGGLKSDDVVALEGREALRQRALEAVQKTIANEGGEGKKVEALLFTSFVMQ
jgi:flagellar FliL protein